MIGRIRTRIAAALTGCALIATPALPLAAQEMDNDVIVVEGRSMTRKQARAEARGMINALGAPLASDQYARWHMPVCPKVLNLRPEHARIITERIREVAGAAGAKVGKPGCKSNILIAFSEDAGALYRKMSLRNGFLFHSYFIGPVTHEALKGPDLPVRWFYYTHTESMAGIPFWPTETANMFGFPDGFGINTSTLDGTVGYIGSRARVAINTAVVLVDVRRAEGVSLDSLASYIAMASLAGQRVPAGAVVVPSITNLFVGGDAQTSRLSEWDQAYLKALYSTPPNLQRRAQRSAMAARIAAALVPRGN